MSTKLRAFIKKIRACKTAEEERMLINKESAHIRNLSKEHAERYRVRSLVKCMFIGLLGYPTEFIHMTCLSLLASQKFTEKKFGYLGVCILLNENSEILLLTAHTIAKDLENQNQYIVASALQALGEIGTPDMCREASLAILKCLESSNPFIKKKAAATLTKVINSCPELLDSVAEKMHLVFEDKNHGVLICGLALAASIFKKEPKYLKKYKKYVPQLLKVMKSLITSSYAQDYDVNGITDPFLQAKLLEVIGLFGDVYDEKSEEISTLLSTVPPSTESSTKNTGNAVLYELVRTIFSFNSTPGLRALGSSIIGKFLENKDNNIKYIALNLLHDIARIDLAVVQKHKTMILEFLSDLDISIKKRSLELTYLIINKTNLKDIITESLAFLSINENLDFRAELSTKILDSLEKYSPSLKWEIDTLIKMLCICDNILSENVISRIVNLFLSVKDLYKYSMFRLFIAMRENMRQESLLKVGVYLLGELGECIVGSSAVNESNETVTIGEKDVLELIQRLIGNRDVSEAVKELLMNCCFKLMTKLGEESAEEFRLLFEQESRSFLCEVQERANEYLVFTQVAHSNLKFQKEITKAIPLKKDIDMEAIISKPVVNEEDNEDKSKGYQSLINNTITLTEADNKLSNNKQVQSSGNLLIDNITDLFANPTNSTKSTEAFPSMFDFSKMNQQGTPPLSNPSTTNPIESNPLFAQLDQVFQAQFIQSQSTTNQPISNTAIPLMNPVPLNKDPPEPKMVLVYQSEDISIYSYLNRSNNSHLGFFYASNNTDKKLSNVKISFLAKKNVQFKVLSTTGTDLEPNASLGIKKEVTLQNNDTSKPIVIKIQLSYTKDGKDIQDACTYDSIH